VNRSIHQYRPKGDPGALPYSPQRDLANIYTPMLKEVFYGLDEKNWAPYMREWFEKEGVDEEMVGKAVQVFVEAHRLFIRDRKVTCPADAFEQAGINHLPPAVRVALFERMGQVLMGGFFIALRDTTMQGQQSAVATDLVEMIAAGRAVANRLSGHEYRDVDATLERDRAEAEETKRVLEQAHSLLEDRTREAYQAASELDAYKGRFAKLEGLLAYLAVIKQSNWLVRGWRCLYFAWRLYRKLHV